MGTKLHEAEGDGGLVHGALDGGGSRLLGLGKRP